MQNNTKLATKLVKILESLGAVEKKGYNSHQKYHYMREVDVMEALKSELVKNKVILLTSSKFVEMRSKAKENANGKSEDFITTVETQHTFIDAESGEQLTVNSVGSGHDPTDKGAAKAITSACKYMILKTFMISDEGADIENDGETKQPEPVKSFNRTSLGPVKTDTVATNPPTVSVAANTPKVEPVQRIGFAKRTTKEPNFP